MTEKEILKNITIQEIVKLTPYLNDIEPKLTKKQRAYAWYYVMTGFQGTEACRLCGYEVKKSKNVNLNFAIESSKNLNKSNIKRAIELIIDKEIKDSSEIKKELFDLLWKRAHFKISIFQNEDGSFKSLNEIPEDWLCVIDGVEEKYHGKNDIRTVVAKLADRDKAIDKLDKFIGMTREYLEHSGYMVTSDDLRKLNKDQLFELIEKYRSINSRKNG